MRASEIQPRKLVIFDIDDTLVHTQTKVHVVKDGRVVKSLNSHDFTHYKLQPDEKFDFENFRNAHDFFHNSKPIIPMMNQLKSDISTGNKVVMVTARADFDDRELFLDTFRKYGVDMNKVHVYRAGNMSNKIQTEEKKKIIIRNLLNKGQYTKAIMYDDAVPNLESFVELKDEYPHTKFYAWHVSLEGEASEYHRTNEGQTLEERRKKKRKSRNAAYGPGLFGGYGYFSNYGNTDSVIDSGGGDGGGDGGGESIEHENFADGRNPQDKGDSKRYNVPTKGSVSSLRKIAKQGGRKGQLAHWMANMKSGKKK
jgi:FMN phosphatase YigB (HAD superfamily)